MRANTASLRALRSPSAKLLAVPGEGLRDGRGEANSEDPQVSRMPTIAIAKKASGGRVRTPTAARWAHNERASQGLRGLWGPSLVATRPARADGWKRYRAG